MSRPYEENEDPIRVIEAEAREVAQLHGAKWCEAATLALRHRLAIRLGGMQIYIPRKITGQKNLRDELVRKNFNGRNIGILAREFETSERTTRRIVKGGNRVTKNYFKFKFK